LELPFLVLHPGAHLGSGEAAGIKQIVSGLDQVFAATKKSPVRIALENTAGQKGLVNENVIWSIADRRAYLRFSRTVQEDWVRT
jgi:deoxyribonuclease-4